MTSGGAADVTVKMDVFAEAEARMIAPPSPLRRTSLARIVSIGIIEWYIEGPGPIVAESYVAFRRYSSAMRPIEAPNVSSVSASASDTHARPVYATHAAQFSTAG